MTQEGEGSNPSIGNVSESAKLGFHPFWSRPQVCRHKNFLPWSRARLLWHLGFGYANREHRVQREKIQSESRVLIKTALLNGK